MLRALSIAALVASLGVSANAHATAKVGVVDVQKVMAAVPAWEKTVSSLKKKWQAKEAKLKSDQAALRTKKEQIDAKKVVAAPATIKKEEQALLEAAQRLADEFIRQQRIITHQELQLKEQMLKRLEPLVYKLAVDRDLAFVFETGTEQNPNVLFSARKVDLTKQVIGAYKKRYKNESFQVTEPKAPGQP